MEEWAHGPPSTLLGVTIMRNFDYFGTFLETTRDLMARDAQGVPTPLQTSLPAGKPSFNLDPFLKGPKGGNGPSGPSGSADPAAMVLCAIHDGHHDAAALVTATGLGPSDLLEILKGQVFLGTVTDAEGPDGGRVFSLTATGRRMVTAPDGQR